MADHAEVLMPVAMHLLELLDVVGLSADNNDKRFRIEKRR
jgi:hypothetical protein